MSELWRRTAGDLAALIRAGEVSSREVVQAHLDRIEEVNPSITAVTVTLGESALAAADAADAASGDDLGPLHGVPFSIKENIDCVGSPTTNGVPALAEFLPERDAVIVERMKRAGGIPLARTNMPEMGVRLDTDNPLRGRTRNPWNPNLTPGGSSGGEASALATGMTPFGLGNDIGGSLRNPAYCCGIASLKPTVGRIPLATANLADFGVANAFLTDGPMARSVADLRLGLLILAGRDRSDPQSVDAPLAGPVPEHPRAALVTRIPGVELPAATVSEIERAGCALADQGWEVEEAEAPELDRVNDIWGKVITYDSDVLFAEMGPILRPVVYESLVRMAGHFDARSMPNVAIHRERRRLRALWSEWLTGYAVAIGPTWTCTPWEIDADLDPEGGLQVFLDTIRFITPGNVLGIPGLALPTGVADGLPSGVQIYAELYRDDLCLMAAEAIEAESPMPTPIDPVVPSA
ncbi:MAG: amidase family protein [Gammaproteobacteria bacterium]|nr:amidase family protein [Gammaproteobacteria bacterium]